MGAAISPSPIRYRIRPVDPAAHLFEVRVTVDRPSPAGQRFALPAWIPGSYMIREFSRHVVRIEARSAGRRRPITKIDKHTWEVARCAGPLEVAWTVYAWDLSVRAAHLDESHGFFNGTSVFLRVLGQEHLPCTVEIEAPEGPAYADWRVATTLARAGASAHGFGRYRAADYDELVDHPVEMGTFTLGSFEACGVVHEIAITGRHDADMARLTRDLAAVCEAQIRLFEPRTRQAPFERYLFLTMAVGEGYGGLEHRASTALLCARNSLPWPGMGGLADSYRSFLGLASHEYFHSWNVKRIKPRAFVPYDFERENYTRLLWLFEGFTSYYDDLMLVRAGVFDGAQYLKALTKTIGNVMNSPGRFGQSVAESSFDAWVKYYRQDENSPNAIVSYYTKGALVGLCLDLTLRVRTGGQRSLDDVMRLLWKRFGREFDHDQQGLDEDGFAAIVQEATGQDCAAEIAAWTHGTDDLPVAALLSRFGVAMALKSADGDAAWLGARLQTRGGDLLIGTALKGGPAQRAGLSAGDAIVAVDGLRVDERGLKALLGRRAAGSRVRVHAFRRDELIEREVVLDAAPAIEPSLAFDPSATAAARSLGARWLGLRTSGPREPARTAPPRIARPR